MGFIVPQIHGTNFFFHYITKNFEVDPCFPCAHLVKHPVKESKWYVPVIGDSVIGISKEKLGYFVWTSQIYPEGQSCVTILSEVIVPHLVTRILEYIFCREVGAVITVFYHDSAICHVDGGIRK